MSHLNFFIDYLFQNSGVKSTITVYISSLPIHIFAIRINFPRGGMGSKEPIGPTTFRPGPILPRVAMEAVIEVMMSIPRTERISALVTKIRRYITTNEIIELIISSGTALLFNLTRFYSSRMKNLEQFRSAVSEQDKNAYNLNSSTCRTGASSDKHNQKKHHFCRFGPEIKVCCRVPCTCHDCNDLENCKPE